MAVKSRRRHRWTTSPFARRPKQHGVPAARVAVEARDWAIVIPSDQTPAGDLRALARFDFVDGCDGSWRGFFVTRELALSAACTLRRAGWHGLVKRLKTAYVPEPSPPPRPSLKVPSGYEIKLPPPANRDLMPYNPRHPDRRMPPPND